MVPLTRAPLLGVLALALLACASPVEVRTMSTPIYPVRRVALVPLDLPSGPDGKPAREGSDIVTARVLESLEALGRFDLIPPQEVRLTLERAGLAAEATPAETGARLYDEFGVDAVLYGRVDRWVRRSGGERGSERPASCWFSLDLRGADGAPIWRGTYQESQQPLTDDPGSLGRAWGRGFRFVTAEALAAYGAEELVRELGEAAGSWR
jgi:hypothetical protein